MCWRGRSGRGGHISTQHRWSTQPWTARVGLFLSSPRLSVWRRSFKNQNMSEPNRPGSRHGPRRNANESWLTVPVLVLRVWRHSNEVETPFIIQVDGKGRVPEFYPSNTELNIKHYAFFPSKQPERLHLCSIKEKNTFKAELHITTFALWHYDRRYRSLTHLLSVAESSPWLIIYPEVVK